MKTSKQEKNSTKKNGEQIIQKKVEEVNQMLKKVDFSKIINL